MNKEEYEECLHLIKTEAGREQLYYRGLKTLVRLGLVKRIDNELLVKVTEKWHELYHEFYHDIFSHPDRYNIEKRIAGTISVLSRDFNTDLQNGLPLIFMIMIREMLQSIEHKQSLSLADYFTGTMIILLYTFVESKDGLIDLKNIGEEIMISEEMLP